VQSEAEGEDGVVLSVYWTDRQEKEFAGL